MRKREILLFFMMGTMMLSGCSKQTEQNTQQNTEQSTESVSYTHLYGVDDSGENALDEDFCFMVTSSRLKQEWDTFFTNGEECVLYYQDYYYKSAQRNPVYAVVVYRDRIEMCIRDSPSGLPEVESEQLNP